MNITYTHVYIYMKWTHIYGRESKDLICRYKPLEGPHIASYCFILLHTATVSLILLANEKPRIGNLEESYVDT